MSALHRCDHCGEALSSPSENYDCPTRPSTVEVEVEVEQAPSVPPIGRRRRSGLSEAEMSRIQSDEFARASLSEISERFNITRLYACITRARRSRA